jgi:hypothetical protein
VSQRPLLINAHQLGIRRRSFNKKRSQFSVVTKWLGLSRPTSSLEESTSMCVDYDRYVDTNLIKDPVSARQFVIGAICAIAAVAIWAGWLVMMRLGLTANSPLPKSRID